MPIPGLDAWLTTPPEDGFTEFCEVVNEYYSDAIYSEMENCEFIESETENKWLNKLFNKLYPVGDSARLIERAFRRYKNK